MRHILIIAAALLFCLTSVSEELRAGEGLKWFKGNTHTHTLWSDGDAAPEVAVKWYKDRGYDFLCLSDHNVFADDKDRWFPVREDSRLTQDRVDDLTRTFGDTWVEVERKGERVKMRLKTLSELEDRFEEASEFLLIPAEEITSPVVHVNGINVQEVITAAHGKGMTNREKLQANFDAVEEQSKRLGIPMFAHLNHPNFQEGVTAEDIIAVGGERFFEVYNGHPAVDNWGDEKEHKQSTDRIWDIVSSMRLKEGADRPLYGLATDDTHDYFEQRVGLANAGRGWIMVLAESLDPNTIVEAVKAGRFYSTMGVQLDSVKTTETAYTVNIAEEDGVSYTTQFIGTPKGFDSTSEPVLDAAGEPIPWVTRVYSDDIGQVLHETTENPATYEYTGDELYVRAKIISDKEQENPFAKGDVEMAWTQPVVVE